jgi:hypothetical protein
MSFARLRDKRIADEANGADREQMCRASDCPNRWSVHTEGSAPLCSAHRWSEPQDWPAVTEKVKRDVADYARAGMVDPKTMLLTSGEKLAVIARMRAMVDARLRPERARAPLADGDAIPRDEILRREDAKRELQRRVDELLRVKAW